MKKYILLILSLLIFAGGFYIYKSKQVGDNNNQIPEETSSEISKYVSRELALQFEYIKSPNGYILQEIAKTAEDDKDLIKSLVLMNTKDFEQSKNLEGSEGPPAINILVFNNPKNLDAEKWANAKQALSGITRKTSEIRSIKIGGIDSILYEADGLYASNVVISVNSSKVYLFIGSYIDRDSALFKDFFTILDSVKLEAINREEVGYYNNVRGYLATPATEGEYPAIILIHEWWGLNDDIKKMADDFAKEGYVALAVDMYNGQNTTDQAKARELVGTVRDNTDEAFNNLKSAVSYLKTRADVKQEEIASVGWCFGGGWSYQMAVNNLGTKGSIMYYGQFDPADDFSSMKAHILGHFGEKDTSIAIDNVKEFQAKLKTQNGEHEVYIYPNVGHGFANARGGTNTAYSKSAADQAWVRTLTFLDKVLEK